MLKAFNTKMSTAIILLYRPKDTLPEWARPKCSTELGLLDYVMTRFPLSPAPPHPLPPKPTPQNTPLRLIPKTSRCSPASLEANSTGADCTPAQRTARGPTSAFPAALPTLSPESLGPTSGHGDGLPRKDPYELPGVPLSRDWIRFIFSLEASV